MCVMCATNTRDEPGSLVRQFIEVSVLGVSCIAFSVGSCNGI